MRASAAIARTQALTRRYARRQVSWFQRYPAAAAAHADELARRAVADARATGEAGVPAAGLAAVDGPGLVVTLDDAPRRPDGSLPVGARPDDLVIHQSDVQAVVNALWAAGAIGVELLGRWAAKATEHDPDPAAEHLAEVAASTGDSRAAQR